MNKDKNISTLGRLLEELSWVGKNIKTYRNGGRGYENILTAETLQALDFLPRRYFLGEVVLSAHGADSSRAKVVEEIELAEATLLPGNFYLKPSKGNHQDGLPVQPDGLIVSPNCFVLIEAKRIRRSSFQTEQLAREFVLLMREANGKIPLLLLLLGSKPPVSVTGHGRLAIQKAITLYLDKVLEQAGNHDLQSKELVERIPTVTSWITWREIQDVISRQLSQFSIGNPSVEASVSRMARSVIHAIDWHK